MHSRPFLVKILLLEICSWVLPKSSTISSQFQKTKSKKWIALSYKISVIYFKDEFFELLMFSDFLKNG